MLGPDFDHLTGLHPVLSNSNNPLPSEYDDAEWMAVDLLTRRPGRCSRSSTASTTAPVHPGYCGERSRVPLQHRHLRATRSDGGESYMQPAPPGHLVAAMPYRWVPGEGRYGNFEPSNIVEKDGFFYAMLLLSTDLPRAGIGHVPDAHAGSRRTPSRGGHGTARGSTSGSWIRTATPRSATTTRLRADRGENRPRGGEPQPGVERDLEQVGGRPGPSGTTSRLSARSSRGSTSRPRTTSCTGRARQLLDARRGRPRWQCGDPDRPRTRAGRSEQHRTATSPPMDQTPTCT